MEIEQAYRKLGVKPGAAFKEVVEAREDLLAVWHPDRLSDKPRLRSKARAQVREINEAYEALMKHLGRTGTPQSESSDPTRGTTPTGDKSSAGTSDRPSASLFDEVFSEKSLKSRRQIPIWPFFAAIIVVGPLISYMLQSSGGEEAAESPSDSPAAEVSRLPEDEVESVSGPEVQGVDETGAPTAEPAGPTRSSSPGTSPPLPDVGTPVLAPTRPDPSPAAPETRASSQPAERTPPERLPTPTPAASPSPDQRGAAPDRPLLVRNQEQAPESETDGKESSSAEVVETPSDEALRAYNSLLQKSAVAQRLVSGGFETLQFSEWKMVQERGSEIWIDLILVGPDGGMVHFIWSVDSVDGIVRALSQAARNLESENRTP